MIDLREEIQKKLQEYDLGDGTDKTQETEAVIEIIKNWALELTEHIYWEAAEHDFYIELMKAIRESTGD